MTATMYPERLRQSVLDDPKKKAEITVYNTLSKLGDPFLVFHSVKWQVRRKSGFVQDGEVDFLVVHPNMGILVLEIKGGGISYDAKQDLWTSEDRNREKHILDQDPVEQAMKSQKVILNKIRETGILGNKWLTIGHAVCFPDVEVKNNRPLKLDLSREIIIDRIDLKNIDDAIVRIFNYYSHLERKSVFTADEIKSIKNLFANSFEIHTPLGVELDEDDEKLVELTDRQMDILMYLNQQRQAIIAGCAGSGKTMLAIEKARRLKRQGFNVLLLCFNTPLATELRVKAPDLRENIFHFHGLCKYYAEQFGKPTDKSFYDFASPDDYLDSDTYFKVVLPNLLIECAKEKGLEYDAIIVDEGQDFDEYYYVALSYLQHADSIFYVFTDDNQNIYSNISAVLPFSKEHTYPLFENCRNTQSIHKIVAAFHPNGSGITCRGPVGRKPQKYYYKDNQILGELSKLIQSLVDEGVNINDIVLLTPRNISQSSLFNKTVTLRVNKKYVVTDFQKNDESNIQIASIYKYKGLDRKIGIIVDLDKFTPYMKPNKLLYIGASRARTHLIFFMSENTPSNVRKTLDSLCE